MRYRPKQPLAPETWERLQELQQEIDALSPFDLQDGVMDMLGKLASLVDATPAFVVVSKKSDEVEPARDPLTGWRPVKVLFHASGHGKSPKAVEPSPDGYLNDPLVRFVVARAGAPRVYRDKELHESNGWGRTKTAALLEEAGVNDRMVGVQTIDAETEVYLSVDAVNRSLFSCDEADVFIAAISMMRRPLEHFARLLGLLDASSELTRRESQTLRHILGGQSEREIAELMGLKPSTLHQYVVQLYRKFGVNSRPELMALWTRGPRPRE